MATKLILFRECQRAEAFVPRCPMFDFIDENDTPEVRALLADGYHVAGHVDCVTPPEPEES